MPKIVNHEERKENIAKATWRVIGKEGIEGATVRAIAKEANVSLGVVRYYFCTQDELLDYAMRLVDQKVKQRIEEKMPLSLPLKKLAIEILLELIPTDSEKLLEMRVWHEFISRKLQKKLALDDGIQEVVYKILNHLYQEGLLKDSIHLEMEGMKLYALIDGLALHVMMKKIPLDLETLRTILEHHFHTIWKEK
ncbi:TetR/AcrR family transcriptional regulator [Massilibacterium senegalense]|uniref:TetR/AcrR family transcriptional regulator n=1 Tax=Massilibacterium senegalense TaxID=1632858 RepID=UPI0007827BE0|nr:TetR/AcrR family transcriptional regulator [Massilibacterium senegalense]